ncbi:DUF930 domain-containing protein [Roseibium sp. FZY0029]|uniref:DUF930 domain-containing protein n=1 Tax=Roseibium sp. FZY0029 TaxID=3116647 RepID=UPI002EB59EBF|nr:DUF930 domain-containing protein [Roseibium sp. FZY0029]
MTRFVAEKFPWICALWLHLALYAVLSDAALWRSVVPDPPEPVSVEIIPEFLPPPVPDTAVEGVEESQQQTAAVPPQNLSDPAPGSTSAPDQPPSSSARLPEQTAPPSSAPKPEQEWVTANTYFANDVLNDPRSAQAREFLPTLTSEDGREQICALEAMEQVRHARPGFKPTRLAPHAFRNSFQKEDTIVVPAGALRSNRVWYEIAYRCRLDASGKIVSGFEYALGAPIDRSLWDEYGLAPIH